MKEERKKHLLSQIVKFDESNRYEGEEAEKADTKGKETAYRRGMHHGITLTINALEAGYNIDQVKQWCDAVFEWRIKQHKGSLEIPPSISDVAKR